MLRIAVDMDDVLAATHPAELAWLAARRAEAGGPPLAVEPASPAELAALEAMIQEGDFFADLAVMPDSQRVLPALAARYEIFVATAAMEYPRSFAAKYAWLRRHFPWVPPLHIVFCGDKAVLDVDFLIDDNTRHFRRLRGQGVLYTAAHNRAETGYPRVDDWRAVEAMFLGPRAPWSSSAQKVGERHLLSAALEPDVEPLGA